MTKITLNKVLGILLFLILVAFEAESQTTTVQLDDYVEHADYLQLGEKGIVVALAKYDYNSIVAISPEGELKWNKTIKGIGKGKFESYRTTLASPDGKYVYGVYTIKATTSWPVTEFIQINEQGDTRSYEYEKLHEKKDKFFQSVSFINLDKREYALNAYYCDTDYFYRIEEEAKKSKKINEEIALEISRLNHESFEFERKYITVPGLSSEEIKDSKVTDFMLIGNDQDFIYLARKSINNDKNIINFQIISIDKELNMGSSKLFTMKLSSGNEINLERPILDFNNIKNYTAFNSHGNIKYNQEDKAYYVFGATKQKSLFLQKLDLQGNLIFETEHKIEGFTYYAANENSITLAKTSDNNLSMGIWAISGLLNVTFDQTGKVVETGVYKEEDVAMFPYKNKPAALVKDMRKSGASYYSGLKVRSQSRLYFHYFIDGDIHYVASFIPKGRKLNLFISE